MVFLFFFFFFSSRRRHTRCSRDWSSDVCSSDLHFDEWDAKGIAEGLAQSAYPSAVISCAPSVGDVLWTVSANGEAVGTVSLLSLDAPVWASPTFGIEVDLEAIPSSTVVRVPYRPIPTMPAI